ncbi:MAG TPA: hypothetical protein VI968_00305 [archaeon]|nr:hypothetical protein [archaeon]
MARKKPVKSPMGALVKQAEKTKRKEVRPVKPNEAIKLLESGRHPDNSKAGAAFKGKNRVIIS